MQRRTFIRLAGGGVVFAAAAIAAGVALTAGSAMPESATAAWRTAGAETEPRRFVLAHAILAPNPHNMQPWIADLGTAGIITLRLDTARLLPATDPFGRQILMGAGAFLEVLAIAATAIGLRAEIALFPDGEPGPRLDGRAFARVRLVAAAGQARDPLFAAITARRTDRRAYDLARPPGAAEWDALTAAIGGLERFGSTEGAADPRLPAIRTIVREAWRRELETAATMMESLKVLRVGGAEIDRYRDGIAITDPLLVALVRTGLFDRSVPPAPGSSAMTAQIDDFDRITAATPAYLWLVTEGNRRAQQIDAGRGFARAALAGAGLGLVMHPNEQSLQEYPEVAAQYQAIHALLEAPAPRFTVQILARVGRLPAGVAAADPAPRRGLGAHVAA